MSQPPSVLDVDAFLDAAVREGMLSAKNAKELRGKLRGQDPVRGCVDAGRLTPVQAEAVEGLLRPGAIADGYEVVGLLGYGGIGVVYRARQPALDRVVALKTIAADRLAAGSAAARFQQEARAVAKLKHPNIVAAYDYGRCLGDETGGRFYLAMELVEGAAGDSDLDAHIRRHATLDERRTWLIVQQVAAALAHAHEAGVVHRDIKPANLLLAEPPAGYPQPAGVPLVKVTDFGLAQLRTGGAEPSTRITVSGATMGTPNYMAPEQINDAQVDHRADIYALGATAFHMLTGKPPYSGQSMMRVVSAKLLGDPDPLDSLPDLLTTPTRRLLAWMMAHDPQGRPSGYAELLDLIADVLQGEGLGSRVVLRPAPPAPPAGDTPSIHNAETVLSDTSLTRRPSRRRMLIGGVAFGVAAAGFGLLWAQRSATPVPLWEVASRRREIPLGIGPGGWSTADGFAETVPVGGELDPFGGYTRVDGAIRWRMLRSRKWSEIGAPEHFGVELRVALGEAESLAVALQWRDDKDELLDDVTIRIDRGTVRLGRGGEPGEPIAYASKDGQREMVVELHRDERHWFAFRSHASRDLIGAVPIRRPAPPTELRLTAKGVTVEQGGAYLGEGLIYALERRP